MRPSVNVGLGSMARIQTLRATFPLHMLFRTMTLPTADHLPNGIEQIVKCRRRSSARAPRVRAIYLGLKLRTRGRECRLQVGGQSIYFSVIQLQTSLGLRNRVHFFTCHHWEGCDPWEGKATKGMLRGNTAVVGLVMRPPRPSISFLHSGQNGRKDAMNCGNSPLLLA